MNRFCFSDTMILQVLFKTAFATRKSVILQGFCYLTEIFDFFSFFDVSLLALENNVRATSTF